MRRQSPAIIRLGLVVIALLALTGRHLTIGTRAQESRTARFEWFQYEGHDTVFDTARATSEDYQNPILSGFYPDPSVTRVGQDYYLVNSSFSYYPGVPIFHSRDLVNWTQIGHVLNRPSQLKLDGLGISRGVFAPTLRHHDGTFYMITTLVDAGGNFYVTATNPAGPWSDPVWLPIDGIDPSLFFDDDGKVYVTNNGPPEGTPLYNGHRAIWIQEIDLTAKALVGPRSVIVNGGVDISKKPIWIEGPHLFKVNGLYYLMAAEGGTGDQHSEVIFRSRSVFGPYEPYRGNPILTQRHLDPARPDPITSTGHADLVEMPDGNWWAVFLGCRPYADDSYNTGRETFLMPVRWTDGWPVITSGDERVPYVHHQPALPTQPPAPVPMAGNFVVRDEFDGPALAPYWVFVRTPHDRWYDLSSLPGSLSLGARPDTIDGRGEPSFVARRQQHLHATVSTALRFTPTVPGDRAGLVAFQNDQYFYFFGMVLTEGGRMVRLEKRAGAQTGGRTVVVASAPLPLAGDGPLYLRIAARGDRYDFAYGTVPDRWTMLQEGADGTILSTKVAGGFVGTMLGMYAAAEHP